MSTILQQFGEDHYRTAFQDMLEAAKLASSPNTTKKDFEAYLDRFEKEAADRDRDISMMQNIRLINLD